MATVEARNVITKSDAVTDANLTALTDGSTTALHSHAGGDSGHQYVDRGDPAAWDRDIGDFTCDGTYRDWDLSAIVDAGAVAVYLGVVWKASADNNYAGFRENGNSNGVNRFNVGGGPAQIEHHSSGWVALDANGKIEYFASANTNIFYAVVRGWLV